MENIQVGFKKDHRTIRVRSHLFEKRILEFHKESNDKKKTIKIGLRKAGRLPKFYPL